MSRRESLTEKLSKSGSKQLHTSISLSEDLIILLRLRAERSGVSISRTVNNLINPVVHELQQSPLIERAVILAQSSARVKQKYDDYERNYHGDGSEMHYGPYPFVGVDCVLPRPLVQSIVDFATSAGMEAEDLMADILTESMPKNN